MTKTLAPATDKQLAFARKLLADRDWSSFGEDTLNDAQIVLAGGSIPKIYASGLIDTLLAMPKKSGAGFTPEPPPASAALEEGVYCAPNGDVIKLQKGKQSGKLYAKVMVEKGTVNRLNLKGEVVHWEWAYAPGLVQFITADMKLGAEAAKDFGIRFETCMWCGRRLKDATSVAKAMGPVCAKRFT